MAAYRIASALLLACILIGTGLLSRPGQALGEPYSTSDFVEVAPQGFGDLHNNGVWSMEWWRGKLYVGTVRDFACWSVAAANAYLPFPISPYPPDPDMNCAPEPYDMSLRAEIWRYTPQTWEWERLYQAPLDVPSPQSASGYFSRDIGYRDMEIVVEPDGTEALYVTSVFPQTMFPENPLPPRLLRSTDGQHFEPIPQEPGTVLGNIDKGSFTRLTTHNSRLYVIGGILRGDGVVWEAVDPAGGNNNYRRVSPTGMSVFEMASFNGYLYVGTNLDFPSGGNLLAAMASEHPDVQATAPLTDTTAFTVYKTDASGEPPYTFIPILPEGGFLPRSSKQNVVSMFVFDGALYVGTDAPTELYRINPDDTWDLVVGTPRETPTGERINPTSGLGEGFGWPLNIHIWRMQEHEGVLYMGTNDDSTRQMRSTPSLVELFGSQFGFDLYATADGRTVTPVTINGFGDQFQMGARGFASTPHGLFVGGVNLWGGLRVWQAPPPPPPEWKVYLPSVASHSSSSELATVTMRPATAVPAPARGSATYSAVVELGLDAEVVPEGVLLFWNRPESAQNVRVYRSTLVPNSVAGVPGIEADVLLPGPFIDIGSTTGGHFLDEGADPRGVYHYVVRVEEPTKRQLGTSNLVRVPTLSPTPTPGFIRAELRRWAGDGAPDSTVDSRLARVERHIQHGDLEAAKEVLAALRSQATAFPDLPAGRAGDLQFLVDRLARRLHLVDQGLLPLQPLR
jgi:hypothetical protein